MATLYVKHSPPQEDPYPTQGESAFPLPVYLKATPASILTLPYCSSLF